MWLQLLKPLRPWSFEICHLINIICDTLPETRCEHCSPARCMQKSGPPGVIKKVGRQSRSYSGGSYSIGIPVGPYSFSSQEEARTSSRYTDDPGYGLSGFYRCVDHVR